MLLFGRNSRFDAGLAGWRIESGGCVMTVIDLTKATVVCGGASYLVYAFPLVGQVLVMALLGVLWLLYAREAVQRLRTRKS